MPRKSGKGKEVSIKPSKGRASVDHWTVSVEGIEMWRDLLFAIIVTMSFMEGEAFEVFDCEETTSETTILDTEEPEQCPGEKGKLEEAGTWDVQVLHVGQDRPIRGFRCQATITQEVEYCGFDSISYGKTYPKWREPRKISAKECEEAGRDGTVKIFGTRRQSELGKELHAMEWTTGRRDENGRCIYGWDSEKFRHTIMRSTSTFKVEEILGTFNNATKKVTFEGLQAREDHPIWEDIQGTNIVWSRQEDQCSQSVREIQTGLAKVWLEHDGEWSGAKVMLRDPEREEDMGLELQEEVLICGRACRKTHIKDVAICIGQGKDARLEVLTEKPMGLEQTRTQMKMEHQNFRNEIKLKEELARMEKSLCDMGRSLWRTRLYQIGRGRNERAASEIWGPGHIARRAGSVVYITKCKKKEASRRDTGECSFQIPVSVEGRDRFVDPITWILQESPTTIPCSRRTPVRWKISGQWFCSTPKVSLCHPPSRWKRSSSGRRMVGFE